MNTMKKLFIAGAGVCLAAAMVAAAFVASAQTAAVGGGSAGTGYASPGYVVSSGPAVIYPAPAPIPTPIPPVYSGFIEFNNLTVESVSGTNPPVEILATNEVPYPVPMMGAATGASGAAGGSAQPQSGMNAPSTATAPAGTANSSAATCYKFETENSAAGTAVPCPVPPAANTAPTTSGGAMPETNAAPTVYPIRYQPYRIEVDASTKLSLRDRTPATLADFAAGDTINVFGYYNSDGGIQAYLIRDLSKPAEDQFIQLNNVTLVSVSASATPATLVVARAQGYPCWGYGATGNATRQTIACPLGAQSPSTNAAMQNIAVPPSIAPMWQVLRKYVVKVDSQTVILDGNRTRLSLADLQVGDSMNIYGDTMDGGQTLSADIVRDLSIPPAPQAYSGTVTQVNADGSFVFQTSNGQTVTVKSPIRAGAALTVTGILDRLSNVLSQVSSVVNGSAVAPGQPVPLKVAP